MTWPEPCTGPDTAVDEILPPAPRLRTLEERVARLEEQLVEAVAASIPAALAKFSTCIRTSASPWSTRDVGQSMLDSAAPSIENLATVL